MSQACVSKMAAEESVHALDRTGESQIISRNVWHRTRLCVNFRAIIYVCVCVCVRYVFTEPHYTDCDHSIAMLTLR